MGDNGEIECRFGAARPRQQSVSKTVNLYVVGDLAYYGMVLGKEGMSGKHCHLCQMSGKEFRHLCKVGVVWTWGEMRELGGEFVKRLKKNANAKPIRGMKETP